MKQIWLVLTQMAYLVFCALSKWSSYKWRTSLSTHLGFFYVMKWRISPQVLNLSSLTLNLKTVTPILHKCKQAGNQAQSIYKNTGNRRSLSNLSCFSDWNPTISVTLCWMWSAVLLNERYCVRLKHVRYSMGLLIEDIHLTEYFLGFSFFIQRSSSNLGVCRNGGNLAAKWLILEFALNVNYILYYNFLVRSLGKENTFLPTHTLGEK